MCLMFHLYFIATMQEKDMEIVTLCEEKLKAMVEALVSSNVVINLNFLYDFQFLNLL